MNKNHVYNKILGEKNTEREFYLSYSNNNGCAKYGKEMQRLISVRPNSQQQIYNDIRYYNFIHFGMNTYSGREWGSGKEKISRFKLKRFDADKIVSIFKSSGSKGLIFTAKHHDGFCLWQTNTTEHSIKNSNYKNGKGDLVRELAKACEKENFLFGIYLSPWDRNSELYGKSEYNDFYLEQLRELTSNYGPLFAIWIDGARDKKEYEFKYDFEAYYDLIRENQPNAVIANMGPDVRWIGNECGLIRDDEPLVVPEEVFNLVTNNAKDEIFDISITDKDLGSRHFLKNYKSLIWYPSEMDISIRDGWFYHWYQRPKKEEDLEQLYYDSVGKNASLLLNVPLNKKGDIASKDEKVLKEFGRIIQFNLSKEVNYHATLGSTIKRREIIAQVLSSDDSKGTPFLEGEYLLTLELEHESRVREIHLMEDILEGQRVEKFNVYFEVDGKWLKFAKCGNIGSLRIIRFSSNLPKTKKIRIALLQSRFDPVFRMVKVYEY